MSGARPLLVSSLDIRPARIADVPAVTALEERSFPAPWRKEFFRGEIGLDGRFNLVAMRGDELAGYVFTMWVLDEMHVNKIAVDESLRRSGIAAELMNRCLEFARERHIEVISLEVRQSNDGARAFYERLGFKSTYVRRNYYPDGESAIVMEMPVTA